MNVRHTLAFFLFIFLLLFLLAFLCLVVHPNVH
nr:MAG TPA: chitin synthase regulator [Caudoviricetes sp.]